MSKSNSLGRNTITITLSRVIALAITMVTAMLLSRFRTVEEYGTYSQLQLVAALFVSVFMMGLPSSINYFISRADSDKERQNFLGTYYTLSGALSLLTGIALALCAPVISSFFDNPAILSFIYFLLLFPWANVTVSGIENVLIVYQKANWVTVYRILESICLLGSVLVIQWLGYGFKEYMVLYLTVYALFALIVYALAYKVSGGFRPKFDFSLIKKIFAFSIPIGLASVMGTLNIEIDKLLIGYVMDTEQMAIYTNASKELPVSFIASSITAVLLPQLTRLLKDKKSESAVSLWGAATELSFILIALIVGTVFTFAEDVMVFLYSDKYIAGIPVFRVYTLILLLRCTYFGMILNAKGKTKDIFWASVGSLIINAIINPLFYYLFGMIGPAIGTFVAMLLIIVWQLMRTSSTLEIPFVRVFPWKKLFFILLISAGFSVCFFGLKQLLPLESVLTGLGESVALGIVWTVLYIVVLKKRIVAAWHTLNQKDHENENTDIA